MHFHLSRAMLAFGVSTLAIAAASFPAQAQSPFAIADATRTSGWQMAYPAAVTNPTFVGVNVPPPGNNNLQGNLGFQVTFANVNPVDISFQRLLTATPDSFGLRVNLAMGITNQSGVNWTSFLIQVIDTNPESPQGSTFHPGVAHVHPAAAYTGGPFPTIYATNSSGAQSLGNNGATQVALSGGTFQNQTSSVFDGYGLHQYVDRVSAIPAQNDPRNFILRLTPNVPTPGTFALVALGLGTTGIRRRNRAAVS